MSAVPAARATSASTFARDVLERSREVHVLVDFWADWCAPCKALAPVLDRIAADYVGRVDVVKLNVDEEPDVAAQLGIRSLPTVKLVSEGRVVDEFTGARPEAAIRAMLDRHLGVQDEAPDDEAPEERLARLQRAHEDNPDDADTALQLAESLAGSGETARAEALLQSLPVDAQTGDAAERVRALLHFATAVAAHPDRAALEQRVQADPDDLEARHALAAHRIRAGEYEAGLEDLIGVLQRDRRFGDELARRALVAAFALLGNDSELVGRYRRRMSALLM